MSEVFQGTFLGEIQDVLASGDFRNEEMAPPDEGEVVIGECTDLEKAVFTVFTAKADEAKQTCKACEDTEEDRSSPKCLRVQQLKKQSEVLRKLFWQLIEDRLDKHETGLSICEGFQIVEQHQSMLEIPPELRAMFGGWK